MPLCLSEDKQTGFGSRTKRKQVSGNRENKEIHLKGGKEKEKNNLDLEEKKQIIPELEKGP